MRDQRKRLMWAIGWWLFRREFRRRTRGRSGGGFRKVVGVLMLGAVVAGGFVAWRRFAGGGDGGGGMPLAPQPEPAPRAPVVV